MAHYVVLRLQDRGCTDGSVEGVVARPSFWQRLWRKNGHDDVRPVVGFAGIWLMVDEAHITTVAVEPQWRGCGLGELLLLVLIKQSVQLGANLITLEVRMSNRIAQQLYEKYGFYSKGVRSRYYSDNGEDALVMWSKEIQSTTFRGGLELSKDALAERIQWTEKF